MLCARPAREDDFEMFVDLARKAGPGFTSLAVGEDVLSHRLQRSGKSFSGVTDISPDHYYLLVLEDTQTNQLVGMSAIKPQIGIKDPFFNFRILKVGQKSAVTNRRYDMDVLILVNEYAGATEVGTLFVDSAMRGTGAGRLISQARYMLMATDPDRFSETIISELRGSVDDTGFSPFWEAIGRKFFLMDFSEADSFSAEHDNQFILDLMPKYPIYAALLPEDAQAAMGQTHPAGIGAKRYLEAEGFRYNGVIDIFDGGPSVSAPRDEIRTLRESRLVKVSATNPAGAESLPAMICNNRVSDFRCVLDRLSFAGEAVHLSEDVLKAMNVSVGDTVRIWIKR